MQTKPCTHCGNVVASTSKICPYCGKNPVNIVVRFILKSFVIGIALVFVLSLFNGSRNPEQAEEANSSVDVETEAEDTGDGVDPETQIASPSEQADGDGMQGADPSDATTAVMPDQPIIPTGLAENAMKEAFETGKIVRVESDGTKGYAVPSEPQDGTGCRSVEFTIDGASKAERSKTICP